MDSTAVTNSAIETPAAPRRPVQVPDDLLARVHDLYIQGRNLDAWELARQAGPIEDWVGTEPRIMAGRLAANLGGMRLATLHHILAWRQDRASAHALYYYARTVMDRKGPYDAWQFMKRIGNPAGANPKILADWFAFGSSVTAMLRDFGTAERLIQQALETAPTRPWIWVERAFMLQHQDRYDEALAAARKSLELQPWYRPAVQTAAQILATLNRDADAIELLEQAVERTQSGPLVAHLAAILGEKHQYDRARALYVRLVELSPLADKDFKRYIAARQCDAACDCGDFAAAAQHAAQVGPGFYEKIAARLAQDLTDKKRVELDVPFVQQHHMTCAPATLASISRFWNVSAEHLDIVESICYDGTPAHSERSWCEQHGYVCREFRVTWDSAVALLDRGIPFTLTTVEVTTAHLQAVTGYDARRGTLLIRDPSWKFSNEILADGLAEHYKSTGPRGMALVPVAQAHLLEGIDLPEAGLYDHFNDVQKALVAHRRDEAAAACALMEQADPNHRLTHWARRSLASYDADPEAQLKSTSDLLAQFPDDAVLKLQKLGLLRHLARRSEIVVVLEQAATPENDPIFMQQYAQELGADPREFARASDMLRTCIRCRPGEPGAYFILANLLWQRREFDEAMDLYRFASCLNDKDDQLATTYFGAARHFKKTDEALALMRDRFERFGKRSGAPGKTLFRALAAIDLASQAFDVLSQAIVRRPDDGDLLLFAADAYARYGNTDGAADLIRRAEGKAHDAMLRRTKASHANYRGALAEALTLWREVLEDEPLALDAHEAVAQLLAETQGRDAAVAHLRAACERFEHNYPLQQLYMSYLRSDNVVELERVVRKLLESRPADPWLIRELAICQARQGQIDAAVATAEQSLQLDHNNSYAHSVSAKIYAAAGLIDKARAASRQALLLSVDNDDAMQELVALCPGPAERRQALAFICQELVTQVTYGDGLLAYRVLANETLDGEETLKTLTDALEARPDLWHAWSAKVRQLADMNRLEEACAIAQAAVEHFPLLPRLWLDLAAVQSLNGDFTAEAESLAQALAISPGWGPAVRQLADSRCRAGDYAGARKILDEGIAWAPLDPLNYGSLAETLWRLDERDLAIETIRKALRIAPSYDWAWSMLRQWGNEINKPEIATEMARELTQRRPGEARSWFTLARALDSEKTLEEALAALDRAIALEPLEIDHHDYKAFLLARHRQYDAALAACRPAFFSDPPTRLKGRAAWVWYMSGDTPRAINEMERVVEEDPRYVWGWTMLADWYRETDRNDGYLRAANALTHLTPLDSTAWCYLGDAQLRHDDKPAARQALERGFELDPSHVFAAVTLFDLQMEAAEIDQAAATLDTLALHEHGASVIGRRVQLHARRDQAAPAVEQLGLLCQQQRLAILTLNQSCEAMERAGWSADVDQVLQAAMNDPKTVEAVGDVWARRLAARQQWDSLERSLVAIHRAGSDSPDKQPNDSPACRYAVGAFLEELDKAKQSARLLRFIHKHRDWLRSDNLYWGTVGAAMVGQDLFKDCIDWMSDWQERQGVEAWMVSNLVTSLHALGHHDQGMQIALAGLALPGGDDNAGLRLWTALGHAWAGRMDQAKQDSERAARQSLPDFRKFLLNLVKALGAQSAATTIATATGSNAATITSPNAATITGPNAATPADPAAAAAGYNEARAILARAVAEFPKYRLDLSLRKALRRTMRTIAHRRGTLTARLWAFFKALRA